MKKYLVKRILFSLFSLVIVLGIVIILIYNLMNRDSILQNDTMYGKLQYNEQTIRKYQLFEEYGYLTYENYTSTEDYASIEATADRNRVLLALRNAEQLSDLTDNPYLSAYIAKMEAKGYTLEFYPRVVSRKKQQLSKACLLAVKEKTVFERLWNFFTNLVKIETIWDVEDENLQDRYIRFEWDKRSNMPALVGSGTTHKYLIYFDNKFPFIHQNIIHIQLGASVALYNGNDVVEYMKSYTGDQVYEDQIPPKEIDSENPETVNTSYDFHTVTYNPLHGSEVDLLYFSADDPYTNVQLKMSGLSRLGMSFVIGIIAVFIAYIIGLPVGIWMALRKDKLVDKLGNLYIIFIMAVPSLAYIFMFASIGISLFGLPLKFSFATNSITPFILPTVSLALPSIGGLMKWMRRFMVDQQNADYVKFARSQGLSEGEIFGKHIAKNAFTFLVHNVPIDIAACLVGAIITERVYGVPGIGNMLTTAINKYDNGVIVGVTAFYTTLTIVALILGDLLLAKYDPRISLTEGKN